MRRTLLVGLALLAATPVLADPPAAYGARRAAELTFRDWRIVCHGPECGVRTDLRAADGAELLALETRGRGAAAALVLSTPLPIFLPDGAEIGPGGGAPAPLVWRTCGSGVCEAVAPLDAPLLDALRRERAVTLAFTLADGVRVRMAASLLGFSAAWRALQDRPAPPPPPAPAPRPAPPGPVSPP